MKLKHLYVALLRVSLFALFSCSKELEMDVRLPSETETVNGISVTWKEGVTEVNRQIVRDLLNDMVFVQGGIFVMGSNCAYDKDARKNEAPAHLVKLTDYYILAHEMTKDLVACVYEGKEPSKYSRYTYYDWEATLRTLSTYSDVEFSFPSEAQWEYAAMGGNKSQGFAYPGGDSSNKVWSDSQVAPGCRLANELGLYNMGDLYGEWCKDLYYDYTDGVMSIDPCNLVQSSLSVEHVVRGGCYVSKNIYKSWDSTIGTAFQYGVSASTDSSGDKRMCRSKSRSYAYAHISNTLVGCRPVIIIK